MVLETRTERSALMMHNASSMLSLDGGDYVATWRTCGPLLILYPARRCWGPPRQRALCSQDAHLKRVFFENCEVRFFSEKIVNRTIFFKRRSRHKKSVIRVFFFPQSACANKRHDLCLTPVTHPINDDLGQQTESSASRAIHTGYSTPPRPHKR